MNQFQAAVARMQEQHGRAPAPKGDDATMKAASAVSRIVAGKSLTREQKKTAGPVVHYAFGSAMGALYGAAAAVSPRASHGWGLPFGAALWFGADEVAVPAAGLSGSTGDAPASDQISALAAHLVYAGTVEAVRRLSLSYL
jgi:uncharacterized membrane protein YagU involved in acid resistance